MREPKPILLFRMTSDTSDEKFFNTKNYVESHPINDDYHVLVFIDDKNDYESSVEILSNPNNK